MRLQRWAEPLAPKRNTQQAIGNHFNPQAWMSAVSKHSKEDAAAMCMSALTIAAGSCYDTMGLNGVAKCPEQFDLTVEAENWEQKKLRGLWQIGEGYDVDVKKQAEAVYTMYTSDNADYGCLSQWCIASADGCSNLVDGIGQDPATVEHHRFCTGVFSNGENLAILSQRLTSLGGYDALGKACKEAAAAI